MSVYLDVFPSNTLPQVPNLVAAFQTSYFFSSILQTSTHFTSSGSFCWTPWNRAPYIFHRNYLLDQTESSVRSGSRPVLWLLFPWKNEMLEWLRPTYWRSWPAHWILAELYWGGGSISSGFCLHTSGELTISHVLIHSTW